MLIRVSIGKVKQTLTRHNFHILHPFPPKNLILKRISFPTTSLQPSSTRNAPFERYKLRHYKSFSKSQQKPLFAKTFYIKIKSSNAKLIKRGIELDILGFPKILRSSSRDKIEQVMACPSWENLGIFKNYALSKFEVLRKGLNFLDFKHLPKIIEDLQKHSYHSLHFLLIFYTFILIYFK